MYVTLYRVVYRTPSDATSFYKRLIVFVDDNKNDAPTQTYINHPPQIPEPPSLLTTNKFSNASSYTVSRSTLLTIISFDQIRKAHRRIW